ncbi:DUF1014-domain-containing protein [Mytilinidion resinicola]|uniref:DUF1014-domain-containing protein n=1 Tax=Mytilinidion resinicola TaxID=574789 RepID=A0A6A6YWY5_9PEZI|nr:DUF1014-domain-containing protein [Mytilinidion resinicola]KAF2812417.1 DUF1014-domain-containing protein [Mytilinidion resinicola]
MAPKKVAGEGSKKAAGQARKAEAAQAKQAAKDNQKAAEEDKEWSKGSKSNSKAEAAAAKAAEAARKKAEKDALLKEEEASLPKAKTGNAKTAQKKSKGIDSALGSFDKPSSLNATGIENALDALDIAADANDKVDRHPERRFKAAYTVFEERRMEEMKDEKGLRRNQKIDQIRKEFEKHPDNPFNQVAGKFNSTREELAEIREQEKGKKESRLASPTG